MNTTLFHNPLYSNIHTNHACVIQNISDNDIYKFYMMQVVFEKYPTKKVKYKFLNRGAECLSKYALTISKEINKLSELSFNETTIDFLRKTGNFKEGFLNYLRNLRLKPRSDVTVSKQNGKLSIIVEGNWLDTILYEIYILAIVSEVRNIAKFPEMPFEKVREQIFVNSEILRQKCKENNIDVSEFKFSEFGTRRRLSFQAQDYVLNFLKREFPDSINGTSNLYLAEKYNLKAIGTMAHEYISAHQAFVNPKNSQKEALEVWNSVYRGSLGIALTDTIGIDSFLHDFDLSLAKLFDGVRHDSNCPFTWGEKMIAHYEKLGLNPKTKTLIFSDSLDFNKAIDILLHFRGRINVAFGIGTFLTNNVGEYHNKENELYKPLNIVMKMVFCDGHDVAKISDEPEKAVCDNPFYFVYLVDMFNLDIDYNKVKYVDMSPIVNFNIKK